MTCCYVQLSMTDCLPQMNYMHVHGNPDDLHAYMHVHANPECLHTCPYHSRRPKWMSNVRTTPEDLHACPYHSRIFMSMPPTMTYMYVHATDDNLHPCPYHSRCPYHYRRPISITTSVTHLCLWKICKDKRRPS